MQRKSTLRLSERRSLAKSNDRRERVTGPRKFRKGEEIANSVLTEADVREIKRLHGPGFGAKKIRQVLGLDVSLNTINSMLYGKTWTHVR